MEPGLLGEVCWYCKVKAKSEGSVFVGRERKYQRVGELITNLCINALFAWFACDPSRLRSSVRSGVDLRGLFVEICWVAVQ